MSVRPYIEILSGPTAGQAAEKIAEILHATKETNGQAEWFPSPVSTGSTLCPRWITP